ncbi:MAG: carboxypeptidase-like regulatory domain-containing protein [bacterium]|nr:carboxypeptidase-like regulatory domain-containing protein [bacterium]
MNTKRKGLLAVVIAVAAGLICVVVFLLFRGPSSPTVEKPTRISPDSEAKRDEKPIPLPGSQTAETAEQARTSFGVLVWPGMTERAMNYSRQILSWMKEWGFECGFVAVQATGDTEGKASALPADMKDGAWKLSEVSSRLNAIVAADGDLSDSQAAALKEYLVSGGWLILPSPEDGKPSEEVQELLRLRPSRSTMLALQSFPKLEPQSTRVLISHPTVPGLERGQWLEWTGAEGRVLHATQDEALPLLCFRRPQLPAVRLVTLGDGAVIHWNFPLSPVGPLMADKELKSLVHDAVAWLLGRRKWQGPEPKEGDVAGTVRLRDGPVISGARVTAQVYSEWGQPLQSFEAVSSENGEFSFPLVEPAVYWVKAEAEEYYQLDPYLLARPGDGKTSPILVLMEREGAVFGHAYYGLGEEHPAAAIPVTICPNCRISSSWEKETVTDREGYFSFDELPAAQSFYLIARAEDWMGIQEAPVPLDGGGFEVDVHLEPLWNVEGTTRNGATQEPLPGAEVLAKPAEIKGREDSVRLFRDALTQTTTSGAQGKFTLKLVSGRWQLGAEAQGFSPIPYYANYPVRVSEEGEITPSDIDIVLELCPHAALYGTVYQSSGQPAPGAKVTIHSEVWYKKVPGSEIICLADDDGRYRTAPLPVFAIVERQPEIFFGLSGEWGPERGSELFQCELSKQVDSDPLDYPQRKSYIAILEGKCPLDVHLRVPEPEPQGVSVSGVVLSPSGEPASLAQVELGYVYSAGPSDLTFNATKTASCDSEGRFKFANVEKGLWLIRAQQKLVDPEGDVSLLQGESWQQVVENAPIPAFEMRLGKTYIRGRIVRSDGRPYPSGRHRGTLA